MENIIALDGKNVKNILCSPPLSHTHTHTLSVSKDYFEYDEFLKHIILRLAPQDMMCCTQKAYTLNPRNSMQTSQFNFSIKLCTQGRTDGRRITIKYE